MGAPDTIILVYFTKEWLMAELILHGVVSGHQVSKCDKNLRGFFDIFYSLHKPGITTNVSRHLNYTIYNFIVYENPGQSFGSYDGRNGSYFGMSLVFQNQFVPNQESVFRLLQKTYDDYVKNKIIKEYPNGRRQWMYPNLDTDGDEIAVYVSKGLAKILKDYPEYNLKLEPLPPISRQSERD